MFDQNTVSQTITFTTNKNWEATVSSPQGFGWCPISPSSGRAGTINMTISPTEPLFPYEEKNAIIAIKAGNAIRTIRVIQKAQTAINPLKDKFEIMKEGGIFEVDVMTNVDLEMPIPSEATWIRVQPEGTRAFLTTKQIKFIVDENREQNSRQTIITIKDKNSSFSSTITVEQYGIKAVTRSIHVPYAGKLKELLGEYSEEIEELTITGRINPEDMEVIGQLPIR